MATVSGTITSMTDENNAQMQFHLVENRESVMAEKKVRKMLMEMVEVKGLSEERAESLLAHYGRLRALLHTTLESEDILTLRLGVLQEKLDSDMEKLRSATGTEIEADMLIETLHQEVNRAQAELTLCAERQASLKLEEGDASRQVTDLLNELEQHDRSQEEDQRIVVLNSMKQELQEGVEKKREIFGRLTHEKGVIEARIQRVQEDHKRLKQSSEELTRELAEETKRPELAKKLAEQALAIARGYEGEVEGLSVQIRQYEMEHSGDMRKMREIDIRREELEVELENQQIANETREREVDDLLKKVEYAREWNKDILTERVKLDLDERVLVSRLKHEEAVLQAAKRESGSVLRRWKKFELMASQDKDSIPSLQNQKRQAVSDLEYLQRERRQQRGRRKEIKADVNIILADVLEKEEVQEDTKEDVQQGMEEIKQLEDDLSMLQSRYLELSGEISRLSRERETKSREATKTSERSRHLKESICAKRNQFEELKRRVAEQQVITTNIGKLYQTVKEEKGKYVKLIQTGAQVVTELRNKNKYLKHEIEMIQQELEAKKAAVVKSREEYESAMKKRDMFRQERNQKVAKSKSIREGIERLQAQGEFIEAKLRGVRRDTGHLQQEYEAVVEERNFIGTQLVEHNDENVILHEKERLQEEIQRSAEIDLARREEEERWLRIYQNDLQREIDIQTRRLAEVPELEATVQSLDKEIAHEVESVRILSAKIESPENRERWRQLGSANPDPGALRERMKLLEERLNEKSDQHDERSMVLDELARLVAKAQGDVQARSKKALDLARRVNGFQVMMEEKTRQMMAMVAELAMLKAKSMRLEQEATSKESLVKTAFERLTNGEAPTDDADEEWERMQYKEELAESYVQQVQQMEREEQEERGTQCRPNAYIDSTDELSIPRPYGKFTPFKPCAAGATMRHICNPRPRNIIL